jgi:hypothetical protein
MRKYYRSMARYRMQRAGIQRMNRKRGTGGDKKSFFAENWREYAARKIAPAISRAKRRAARQREAQL